MFFTPSKPAAKITASARYGLVEGSGERSSMRVESPREEGILISGLRF